ncbi:hypothetical protein DAQ1742_01671 [Dickeya aquatica]|uniref:Uncharacterized protein n=1 Tax=Dickeya aquatica TaxID=1401087 RepID=A0A375A991_9GAMM|nr:hypothetical protein DAQ1742_01671 [Dickeya aquatica]
MSPTSEPQNSLCDRLEIKRGGYIIPVKPVSLLRFHIRNLLCRSQ